MSRTVQTVRQVFHIQSAMGVNRLLFWLRKVPLVKRLFPERLYGAWALKQRLMAVVEVLKVLYAFGGKFLYLFLCCGLPAVLLAEEGGAGPWAMFLNALFFLSFFGGCFLASDVLAATLIKYTCVRQMGMEARACILATSGRTHVLTLVSFTPALIAAAAWFGQPWWQGLLFSLELAACRCLGERFHLWLFDRTGKPVFKKVWYVMVVTLASLGLAYVPLMAGAALPMDRFLLNGAVAVVLLVGGAWAAVSLVRYPRYWHVVHETCKPETVSTTAAKANAARAAFKDVEMRSGDVTAGDASPRIRGLKGYQYLNALFFRRHRRILTKPMRYELIGIALAAVALAAAAVFLRAPTAAILEGLPQFLPVGVFAMYLLCNTLGQQICKAMFYNCDISLLRFGWYRERKVLLHNFAIRLGHIARVNLTVGAAICAALALGILLSGAALSAGDMVPFFLCVLLLAFLFSVHPLFLYYVFQPYTTQLAVKNPLFTLINWGMYLVCWMCVQIDQPPEFFSLLVLGVTAAYIAAALALVWLRAPKTFRVK